MLISNNDIKVIVLLLITLAPGYFSWTYLRSFYITDVKWLSNQTLFCSWVSKGITSLIQTAASQQNKWHLNEVRNL